MKVDDYLTGYTTTQDVCNHQGLLLLKSGSKLTPAVIELLRKNNIMSIECVK